MTTKAKANPRTIQIIMLERVKRNVGPLCVNLDSNNWRDRARKIYDMARELQDELKKASG